MSYPCRCTNCNKRKSITNKQFAQCRSISEWRYKCPKCGNRKWRLDKWRLKNELGIKPTCNCGGYHFIHREHSLFCLKRDDAEMIHTKRWIL